MGRMESSSSQLPAHPKMYLEGTTSQQRRFGYVEGSGATLCLPRDPPPSADGSGECSAAPGSEASPPGLASLFGVAAASLLRPRQRLDSGTQGSSACAETPPGPVRAPPRPRPRPRPRLVRQRVGQRGAGARRGSKLLSLLGIS